MRLLSLAGVLVFASGFCTLAYQIVWMRLLRLLFGASTPATATVLAVFMGGLGLGGLLIGARADRSARPMRLYAFVELGITLSAAATPLLIKGAGAAYVSLGGTQTLGDTGGVLVRLLLATIAIGGPAVLMGGTLPAIARASVPRGDDRRLGLGLLYGLNTLGACAGAFAATFVMVERLGVSGTLFFACALNALLGGGAYLLAARAPDAAKPSDEEKPNDAADDDDDDLPVRTLLVLAFASGLLFFTAELVWYRLGAPILGGSTYTFGVILAVVLLGIGAGGAVYAIAPPRQPTMRHLALTFSALAFAVAFPLALGDRVAVLAQLVASLGQLSFVALGVGWTVVAAVLVLPTAVVAGYQLPLLLGVRGRGPTDVGKHTGELYAANTIGAIAGSLFGGFVALPMLGAVETWRALGLVLAAIGIALTLRGAGSRRVVGVSAVLAALALLSSSAEGPTAFFRHQPIGAGRARVLDGVGLWEAKRKAEASIVEEHDGREVGVGLHAGGGLSLINSGKNDGNVVIDQQTNFGVAAIPALLHGDVKRAFVVGLASGQTAGFLGKLPDVERVTVAEIEPAVRAFSRLTSDSNFDVLNNPRVKLVYTDAREALATSTDRYDLIVSEPSNPYRAGVASLYSLEFYQAVNAHLREGGLFAMWMQGYESSPVILTRVLTTLQRAFKHTTIWVMNPDDLMVIAASHPTLIDDTGLEARLRQPPFDAARRVLDIYDTESLIARHVATHDFVRQLTTSAKLQPETDDRPRLEFDYARAVGQTVRRTSDDLILQARARAAHQPLVRARYDAPRADELSWRRYLLLGWLPPPGVGLQPTLVELFGAIRRVDSSAISAALDNVGHLAPDDGHARLLRAFGALMIGGHGTLPNLASELADLQRLGFVADVAWLRVLDAQRAGGKRLAATIAAACKASRKDPWGRQWIASFALKTVLPTLVASAPGVREDVARALLAAPLAGYSIDTLRIQTAQAIAATTADETPPAFCVDAFEPHRRRTLWERSVLQQKLRCFEAHAKELVPDARSELEVFDAEQPPTIEQLLSVSP